MNILRLRAILRGLFIPVKAQVPGKDDDLAQAEYDDAVAAMTALQSLFESELTRREAQGRVTEDSR